MIIPFALALHSLAQPLSIVAPSSTPPSANFLTDTSHRSELMAAGHRALAQLIAEGEIESIWRDASAEWPRRQPRGGEAQWIVVFRDATKPNPYERTLFVTLADNGDFLEFGYRRF